MRLIDADEILNLFGISDRDIYAREAIEEALLDGTLSVVETETVKHGRWIHKVEDIWDLYKCSECGRSVDALPSSIMLDVYPYCHCGAKMDEVKE